MTMSIVDMRYQEDMCYNIIALCVHGESILVLMC